MKESGKQYRDLKRLLQYLLLADLISFVVLLTASAYHIKEVMFFTGISTILLSVLCIVLLYRSNELLRRRSIWITLSAGAIALCATVSLLLGYPSPNPLNQKIPFSQEESTQYTEFHIPNWQTEPTEKSYDISDSSNSRYDTEKEYLSITDNIP